MSILLRMCIAAGSGYAAHQTRRYYLHLSNGMIQMISYSIGALSVLPFAMWIWAHLHDGHEQSDARRLDLYAASYLLAFLSFGAGVFVGWVVGPDER